MDTRYELTGLVHGNYWGGGEGAYKSTPIYSKTKEEGLKKAEEMLDSGALDDGMGYESLIGAILDIKEIKTTEVEGEEFSHENHEIEYIGKLTERQEDFLYECLMQL